MIEDRSAHLGKEAKVDGDLVTGTKKVIDKHTEIHIHPEAKPEKVLKFPLSPKLISRTGFKFYEPDAEIILANVYLAEGNLDKAKELTGSSYKKAKKMHYHWAELAAEHLLKELSAK